jgi:uncharacterized SAM-binding protein YcdF (DUF218 family)
MKRPSARALLLLLVGLGLLVGLAAIGVRSAGRYLVVADPLAPSDGIFVLAGKTPARELEAAMLYRRRLAPWVVLTRARDPLPLARQLAGEPTPQERAARALRYAGVPAEAIVQLTPVVENTEQELAVQFAYARAQGFRRVILVSSPAHTRRVRVIWNARHQAAIPALVHPTSFERYDPDRWWRSRNWLEDGLHELIGIAHFLVGSPLPSHEPER